MLACQEICWKKKEFLLQSSAMRKDAPLAFRLPADLKKRLQEVGRREARSLSQICEMLLRLGVEAYEKEGPKYLQRFLSRQKKEDPRQEQRNLQRPLEGR